MGKEFIMLTGEDGNALEFNKRGGRGCISVTANVAAKLCSEMQNASLSRNDHNLQTRAEEINKILTPLNKSLFIESNPSPVKHAASLLGLSPEDVRLPLVKVTDEYKKNNQRSTSSSKINLMKQKRCSWAKNYLSKQESKF